MELSVGRADDYFLLKMVRCQSVTITNNSYKLGELKKLSISLGYLYHSR